MILWTMQHRNAVEQLLKDGVLRADENRILNEDFMSSYKWLVEEMKKRIGAPPNGVRYPIWAWHSWEGKRGYPSKYKDTLLLTIDVEESNVLLSDFDDWHFVLNNWYLSLNEQEFNDISNPTQTQITDSWQRIFDLTKHTPGWNYPLDKKSIQATFWELNSTQVIAIDNNKLRHTPPKSVSR